MKTSLIGAKVCIMSQESTLSRVVKVIDDATGLVESESWPIVNIPLTPETFINEIRGRTGTIVAAHMRQGYLIFTIELDFHFLEATSDMLRLE